MNRVGTHTHPAYFVETWAGKYDKEVSYIGINQTGIFHFISIIKGDTVLRDLKVVGKLPQGVDPLAFSINGIRESWWEKVIHRLPCGKEGRTFCEIAVITNAQIPVRIQCAAVLYEDVWNPNNTWRLCTKNLPLEFILQTR